MARSALIASALVVVSLLVSPTPTESAEQRDIVSQDLKLLRAPGKVEAAIWTDRKSVV